MTISMDFADVPMQWHGDLEIMQLFIQTGWKQPALQALNQYQMYLKVFLLSDIVIGSGESIATQFWDWRNLVNSPFEWPHTVPPTQQLWPCLQPYTLDKINGLLYHLENGMHSSIHVGVIPINALTPFGKPTQLSGFDIGEYHNAPNNLVSTVMERLINLPK